jgi:HAD superfamily hydrolase (TIGR01509 family)
MTDYNDSFILNYDLFIFDFDGTILDTEPYHCLAWNKALSEHKNEHIELSFSNYQYIFHNIEKDFSKKYLTNNYKIFDYDSIYKLKQSYYENYILNINDYWNNDYNNDNNNNNEQIKFINNCDKFIEYLLNNNKKLVMVTNTSKKFINIFKNKNKYNILNKFDKIYTKEDFTNRKPNPECYLKIAKFEEYKDLKKIAFEDSLTGITALCSISVDLITPVLLYDKSYYFNDYIDSADFYKNIIKINDYNISELSNILKEDKFITNILNNNINEFKKNFYKMKYAINNISAHLNKVIFSNNNESENYHIYLSGMGKSGYVCKKSASTWQSLSLRCSYLDLPNLPHGDFGIFRNGDILILISNGGNTSENVYILNYIKNHLTKKVITISIIAKNDSEMERLSDYSYILENINEADSINMTPSTSSLIFMSILDGIAINLRKDITKQEFQHYHPGGSLGSM